MDERKCSSRVEFTLQEILDIEKREVLDGRLVEEKVTLGQNERNKAHEGECANNEQVQWARAITETPV